MKTKKSFANIVFIIFLIAITFSSLGITKDQDNDKPKMFIKNLTGDRVDKKLLERIRGKILTTIIDISGSEYNILDDDTVIAMYDQAKKIMASGCNDDSSVKQIAEGINADVIIHGEVNIDDENVTISVQRVDRNRKTLEMSITSRVTQTFKESQADWFAEETAKKLLNPKHKIDPLKAPKEFDVTVDIKTIKIKGSEDFNVEVLQFQTNDDTVQQILDIAKKHLKEGDTLFAKKEYENALDKYKLVVERIDEKLTDENKEKIDSFRRESIKRADTAYAMIYKTKMEKLDSKFQIDKEGDEIFLNQIIGNYHDLKKQMNEDIPRKYYGKNIQKLENAINNRIDSCYIAICGLHEKIGDSACGDYNFYHGYDEYNKALIIAGYIVGEIKYSMQDRYRSKLVGTQKTGENYMAFKVKSYTDRAQIYHFDDKTSDAKKMLFEARKYMTGGMSRFVTREAIDKYNSMAKVLDVDQINENSESNIKPSIQDDKSNEIKNENSTTSFADYFSYPTVNKNGIAYTIYNKQVTANDMDTLSVVLLSGYTYIEQTLNHYGYIGVAVQFSDSTNKLYVVERAVFDQFLKNEIDATTFVNQLKVMNL